MIFSQNNHFFWHFLVKIFKTIAYIKKLEKKKNYTFLEKCLNMIFMQF